MISPARATDGTGVDRVDVKAVNAAEQRPLYASRVKIFPKRVHGPFRTAKWIFMALALAAYYLAPWLRWERPGETPDQAILLDLAGRRFYFFFVEIWPQEVYYFTGLLILAALLLFLATALFGRVWCGYACPQTVWTDLFIFVERMVEGDRGARIRLDNAPMSVSKLAKRSLKHVIWIVIAMATGGAWVFYFADAPTLTGQLLRFDAPLPAYVFIAMLTAFTYLLGGFAREQVCTYMCPWPRIQAALIDEETFTVAYRPDRGEPRGRYRRDESWEGRGDCIDCNQCVAACPMGIDIRDGLQLECTSCALCIDACNEVMDRVGRPRWLIAYDNDQNMARRASGEPERRRLVRPRTVIYAALMVLVGLVMLAALTTRGMLEVNVLHDRNPLYVLLKDGSIRNGYTVKIINKLHAAQSFEIAVDGIPQANVAVLGADAGGARVEVGADRVGSFRLFVGLPRELATSGHQDIVVSVTNVDSGERVNEETRFHAPG